MAADSEFCKKEMIRVARKIIKKKGVSYFSNGKRIKGISFFYDYTQANLISVFGIAREGFFSFLFEVSQDKTLEIVAVYEEIQTQKKPF
jgi:hypothetical protein